MKTFKLVSDQAIGEDGSERVDGLGFNTYATILSRAALGATGPLTIGVFGEWGTGKTSLMHLMRGQLKHDANCIVVWFNAWRFEREKHPIIPLIITIIREIEKKPDLGKKLAHRGKSLATALRGIVYGLSGSAKFGIPSVVELETSFSPKEAIDREEKLLKDPFPELSVYYQAFEELTKATSDARIKVIVIIDDLDRCFPAAAIGLLEGIKLILTQPGFVFIIGVARSVIEGYLQHRYEREYGIKDFKGEAYLDKIVQLPFHIPPHSERMGEFSKTLLQLLAPEDQASLKEILVTIGMVCGNNPRTTIRFINNIITDSRISQELAEQGLMEDIPLGYFAITRSLQLRWPKLFDLFMLSEETCNSVASGEKSNITRLVNSEVDAERIAGEIIVGDSNLQRLLFSSDGLAWLQNKPLRLAASQFLRSKRIEPKDGEQYDVFLNYQKEDRAIAELIATILIEHDLRVFLDVSNDEVGTSLVSMLETALNASRSMATIVGPTFDPESDELVTFERNAYLHLSLEDNTRHFFAILLPGAKIDSLPLSIRIRLPLDLTDGKVNAQSLERLISELKRPRPLTSENSPAASANI